MVTKKTIISALLAAFLVMPVVARAAVVLASTTNNDWEHALSLGRNPTRADLYGRLSGTGDARYYEFSVTKPGTIRVVMQTVPDVDLLEPRLVLYAPEMMTIGPALPMPQPPRTLAAVYGADAKTTTTEGPFRTKLSLRFDHDLQLDTAGTYYLAVYNAGQDTGAYRLRLSTSGAPSLGWNDQFRSWWLTNAWLGPQFGALTIPLMVGVAAAIAWLIISKVPHPQVARARVRTSSRSRRSSSHGNVS